MGAIGANGIEDSVALTALFNLGIDLGYLCLLVRVIAMESVC